MDSSNNLEFFNNDAQRGLDETPVQMDATPSHASPIIPDQFGVTVSLNPGHVASENATTLSDTQWHAPQLPTWWSLWDSDSSDQEQFVAPLTAVAGGLEVFPDMSGTQMFSEATSLPQDQLASGSALQTFNTDSWQMQWLPQAGQTFDGVSPLGFFDAFLAQDTSFFAPYEQTSFNSELVAPTAFPSVTNFQPSLGTTFPEDLFYGMQLPAAAFPDSAVMTSVPEALNTHLLDPRYQALQLHYHMAPDATGFADPPTFFASNPDEILNDFTAIANALPELPEVEPAPVPEPWLIGSGPLTYTMYRDSEASVRATKARANGRSDRKKSTLSVIKAHDRAGSSTKARDMKQLRSLSILERRIKCRWVGCNEEIKSTRPAMKIHLLGHIHNLVLELLSSFQGDEAVRGQDAVDGESDEEVERATEVEGASDSGDTDTDANDSGDAGDSPSARTEMKTPHEACNEYVRYRFSPRLNGLPRTFTLDSVGLRTRLRAVMESRSVRVKCLWNDEDGACTCYGLELSTLTKHVFTTHLGVGWKW
ncbi:hypothetical protein AX17_002169 [Amanita inopinata Kibby_2008]|nr:hypothetical protein AX17_002169 [Amanita inopinata Kibby_2008]